MKDHKGPIESVLAILKATRNSPLSVKQLSQFIDLDQSGVYRYLYVLMAQGFIDRELGDELVDTRGRRRLVTVYRLNRRWRDEA